jgi:hypothetical protein
MMDRKLANAGTAFAAAALLSTASHATNLLTNGSFENPAGFVDNTGGGAMLLDPGATTMTGWTVIGSGSVLWAGPGSTVYMGGLSPSNGQYFLDLTGLTNQCPPIGTECAGVTQTVSTVFGEVYQLSFDFGGRVDSTPVSIEVFAGAASQSFWTPVVTWTTETMSFIGTGSPTTISLVGTYAGGSGLELSLDNVVVTPSAIPEPSTWAMMALGFASLGFAAFRQGRRISAAIA